MVKKWPLILTGGIVTAVLTIPYCPRSDKNDELYETGSASSIERILAESIFGEDFPTEGFVGISSGEGTNYSERSGSYTNGNIR